MVQCPVCGEENPPDAANCKSCQLATSLFEPVREAAGTSSDDASAARAIAEILAAVGPEKDSPEPTISAGNAAALQTAQARFPALTAVRTPPTAAPSGKSLPAFPVLAPGSGVSLAHRQIEELLAVGRREGIDLGDADQKMLAALKDENRSALDELRRSVFVQVAATVAEDLEIQSGRRNELAALVPTPTIDVELESARASFASGDLPATVRRLRQTSESLSALEDRWATCQILTAEADLMIETLRELGEDPGRALGPFSEGKRLAQAGDEVRAERVLAGANRALWGLLVPQLNRSLQVIRAQLQGHASTEEEIEPVVRELRQLSAMIRRRNFGSAVTSYRRLRRAASALSARTGA
jgi:hypothetical protein